MKRALFSTGIFLILFAAVAAFFGYSAIWKPNVQIPGSSTGEVYVLPSWNYDSLKSELNTYLISEKGFDLIAGQMNLPNRIVPGKYIIRDGWSNRDLINHFRSGNQEQISVLLKGSIDRRDIIRELARKLLPDTGDLDAYIDTSTWLKAQGYNSENWPCLMMANTYFFHWAVSPDDIFKRFKFERESFWAGERASKIERMYPADINDIIILASIVDAETIYDSEMPRIAGVYLNRLEKGWPLQADPTIRYIVNEAGRQRVLHRDLEIDHPYNTYKHKGLPPGPVLLPSVKAVDAVLEAESHDFMFFCAKPDLSGYHLFTSSSRQHEINAHRYHRALDARNIRE